MHFYYYLLFLQELSIKAESKFNKLKTQAKTKISSLTDELEKVKGELSMQQVIIIIIIIIINNDDDNNNYY